MTKTCPATDLLRSYAVGRCDDASVDEIEQHLALCPACEETLARFDDTKDSLIRSLPLAGAESAGSPAAGWLARLRARPPRGDEQRSGGNDAPADDDRLPQELSSYQLLGVLGQGGMGVVYKARHKQLDRLAAIKVLSPRLTSAAGARRRFEREIRILGNLRHPGIVMATDAGRIGQAAYLVMELVEGVDLARLVRRAGPLSVGEACEAARQMASALAAAHQADTIHRDVKPSNAMLDADGRVKLLDFGLANLATLAVEDRETSLGRLLGTLDYMAPEQAAAREDIDCRADVYSLGATLFYLLTGRPPHGANSERSLLDQIRSIAEDEPPQVSSLRADVPAELDALMASMLSRDPAQRPASAEEVAQQLTAWAAEDLRGVVNADDFPAEQCDASSCSAAERSLARLLGEEGSASSRLAAKKPQDSFATATTKSQSSGAWIAIAVAAAIAALIVYAGLVLLLQTPAGVVRVETEVEGVKVELVDERDAVYPLTIENEAEETVLRAGRYRVRLAGAHDGLSVEPQTITLRKGETEIARITRSEQVEPPAPAMAGAAERVYLNEPESVWRRRFVAEQDPTAKVVGARALVVLAAARSPREQLQATLEVGGELAASGWGGEHLLLPVDFLGANVTVGPNAPRWQGSKELIDAWIEFYKFVESKLRQIPAPILAEGLGDAVAGENLQQSSFAAWLLANPEVASFLQADEAAHRIVLQKLDVDVTGLDRTAVAAILRFRLRSPAHAENDADLKQAALALAHLLIEAPNSPLRDKLAELWLQNVSADPEITARVILRELTTSPRSALNKYFSAASSGGVGQFGGPYDNSHLDNYAMPGYAGDGGLQYGDEAGNEYSGAVNPYSAPNSRARPAWMSNWMHVASEYLERRAGDAIDQNIAAVIHAAARVLQTRTAEDEWDVAALAELLSQRLRTYYSDAEGAGAAKFVDPQQVLTVTPAVLLMQMVHCGAQMPDIVRSGPVDNAALAAKIADFEQVVNTIGQRPDAELFKDFANYQGLTDDAPYQVVRVLLENFDAGDRAFNLLSLADVLTIQKTYALGYAGMGAYGGMDPYAYRGPPQSDGLLMLAILADLAGESQQQDGRIAPLLDGGPNQRSLQQTIRGSLGSQSAQRDVVRQLLQQMADKTLQPVLVNTIKRLDPSIAPAMP